MPIMEAAQRRFLFEKNLVYLFSYDLDLQEEARVAVPGGLRISTAHVAGKSEGREGDSFKNRLVYHVLDNDTVEGNDAIVGNVQWIKDSTLIGYNDRTGSVEGRIAIKTSDHAILDSRYGGSFALSALGLDHLRRPDEKVVTEKPPLETQVKMFIAPRFDTAYPKYKWLSERQCAGFGSVTIKNGEISRATFDIYCLK